MLMATFRVTDKAGSVHMVEDTGSIAAMYRVDGARSVKRVSEFYEVPMFPRLVRKP